MQEVALTPQSLPGFAHLIPAPLQQELQDGKLAGVGALDLTRFDRMAVEVLLCRWHENWMEIVWMAVDPQRRGRGMAGWLLDRRIDETRICSSADGIFVDLPQNDMRASMESLLTRRGFALTEVEQPVFSIGLDQLSEIELLARPVSEQAVVPLEQADADLRRAVVETLQRDSRPVPLATPVDWQRYDPEISAIARLGGKPVGLLLATRGEGSAALELLWASQSVATAQLLAFAAQRSQTLLPSDTRVVLPTVTDVTREMVNRLVPDAQPLRLSQARLYFGAHAGNNMEVQ